jgi:hypothetical protein
VSEVVRGISADQYPTLLGYVATTPKPRAEIPLYTDKGDPLLAHWQYGLGRAVAFTSDAKSRWAKLWLNWENYRQFWSQIGQWSLRRLESSDFTTEVSVENGQGALSVDVTDEQGNYRNFANLQAVVASPKGERQTVRVEQTGPGHYEARFPTKDVGSYMVNLMEMKDGKPIGMQAIGASVNYSPEFTATEPNFNLLRRLADSGHGKLYLPGAPPVNPFEHDRKKTHQARELWESLLKFAILLFVFDVGVRRIQIDREEWAKLSLAFRRRFLFWKGVPRTAQADESLGALLTRREQVRATQTAPAQPKAELFQPARPVTEPLPGFGDADDSTKPDDQPPQPPADSPPPAAPGGTTSRLLEAKRRAQKRNQ